MQLNPTTHTPELQRVIGHVTALVLAVAAGLLAEFTVGDGLRWLPTSPVAWFVTLTVFALGEGFLHWLLRQARRVAEEDVLFRGLGAQPRDLDRHQANIAASEHATRGEAHRPSRRTNRST